MKAKTTIAKASVAFTFCASLANISLDKSGLVFETAGNCSNARLNVDGGKLVISVKPYFYIKIR